MKKKSDPKQVVTFNKTRTQIKIDILWIINKKSHIIRVC